MFGKGHFKTKNIYHHIPLRNWAYAHLHSETFYIHLFHNIHILNSARPSTWYSQHLPLPQTTSLTTVLCRGGERPHTLSFSLKCVCDGCV